jgi:hypothetical protein
MSIHIWAKQQRFVSYLLCFALACGIIGLFVENIGLLVLVVIAVIVLSPLYLYLTWLGRDHQIVICSEGLLFISRGLNDTAIRWDEIEDMSITTHPLTYVITYNGQTTFKLRVEPGTWTHSIQLYAMLERGIIQPFLPDAIKQFEQSGSVFFGDICVRKEGLTGSFGMIPWSEIKEVYRYQAELIILETSYRRQRLQFSPETRNPLVLTALVRHILNARKANQLLT